MNNAIAIFASARRNGNTGKLIDWIAGELGIEVIDLSEKNISPYDYDHKNINDDFLPLMQQLLEYEKIIFVTPVYWYGPSAQMKIFIDRTCDFLDLRELKDIGRQLRGKVAYIVCTSISQDADSSFINSLKDTFGYLGMKYGGYVHANCENGYTQDSYRQNVDKFIRSVRDSDKALTAKNGFFE
ncbi:MAG: NADPH-dependent oxidoreductase [Proteobacteria bacterium]|nr:MAG: NADPH-dependent oxidoreductase [Pseudomonadota bacterium]